MKLRVFLIDDEPLALKRLSRLLEDTGRVEIIGRTSEPREALKILPHLRADAIFLDIQMPELTGFELLRKLEEYPPVIFTTAFDEFALEAFDVYSVDYLLKPIASERLEMALDKLERIVRKDAPTENIERLLENLAPKESALLERLASRIGGKVRILDVSDITHFSARDKLTFAGTADGREFPLDLTLNKLEERLDRRTFLRVHRSSIVNLDFIEQVHGWFSGRVLIRLKDDQKTEIAVARERVRVLKNAIGM